MGSFILRFMAFKFFKYPLKNVVYMENDEYIFES